jgi:hypothetical protein
MITRAYQNAKGERQEVAMAAEAWEVLTEDQLQEMLGFAAPVAAAPVAAPAPPPAPVAKPKAKGK